MVTVYSSDWCGYCRRALNLLNSKGAQVRKISVDGHRELRQEMMEKSGRHSVPQIWIGDRHIGGCDDLYALDRAGQLDGMLAEASSGEAELMK